MRLNILRNILAGMLVLMSTQACFLDDVIEPEVNSGKVAIQNSLIGRIVDAKTGDPISGATITFYNNGIKRVTTSLNSTDAYLNGSFRMTELRQTSQPSMFMVEAEGYATIISNPDYGHGVMLYSDNENIVTDLGRIGMGAALTQNVIVSDDDGVQVPNAEVYAYAATATGLGNHCTHDDGAVRTSQAPVTTDASGIATLTISDCVSYNFLIPGFDADGDGVFDYFSSWAGISIDTYEAGTDIGLIVNRFDLEQQSIPNSPEIASSLEDNETASSALSIFEAGTAPNGTGVGIYNNGSIYDSSPVPLIGTTESIVFILRMPSRLTYLNDQDVVSRPFFMDPDFDDSGAEDNVSGVDRFGQATPVSNVSLDSTGTILTIAPPAGGWTPETQINGDINLDYIGIDDASVTLSFVARVTKAGSALATGFAVTADNYDGESVTPAGNTRVYLEFSDYVEGTFRVLSTTAGGVTTAINGAPIAIVDNVRFSDGNSSTSTVACNLCGTGAGAFYVSDTSELLDNGDTIEIHLDAVDLAGNAVNQIMTLTVE